MTGAGVALARLRLERLGGLAGLKLSAECAAAALTATQCRALDQLLLQADAPGGAAALAAPAPGADRFRYRLHLTLADGSQRSLDIGEQAMPEALASLSLSGNAPGSAPG